MPGKVREMTKKPNILVIWGDDIGIQNLSCYSHGVMGYRTPNIDRLAKEGMMFTDSYGEQSCTAGRASFITGQSGYRTGLTKVGLPARRSACKLKTRRSPNCSSHLAMRRASSARTTWATRTSICRPPTGSTNFMATSTTSTRKRIRRIPTIRKTPNSRRSLVHAVCCTASRPTRMMPLSSRAGDGWQTENQGHWSPHAQAHGDLRR